VDRYAVSVAPDDENEYDCIKWVDQDNTILDWNGLLPPSHLSDFLVRCPLVYSPTRWAIRRLTPKELSAAYDVPERVLPDGPLSDFPFLLAAPIRLLDEILRRVVSQTITHQSYLRTAPLQNCPLSPLPHWDSSPNMQWNGAVTSALKADDAVAPSAHWDERVWRLPHSAEKVQFYISSFGINPLDSLRDFFLRIWRRRVTRSLCKYL
jgi:hypothetical protein